MPVFSCRGGCTRDCDARVTALVQGGEAGREAVLDIWEYVHYMFRMPMSRSRSISTRESCAVIDHAVARDKLDSGVNLVSTLATSPLNYGSEGARYGMAFWHNFTKLWEGFGGFFKWPSREFLDCNHALRRFLAHASGGFLNIVRSPDGLYSKMVPLR
jgi:hypothetical protein